VHPLVLAITSGSTKVRRSSLLSSCFTPRVAQGRERAACLLAHAAIDAAVKRLIADAPVCAALVSTLLSEDFFLFACEVCARAQTRSRRLQLPLMDASAPAPVRQCCRCVALKTKPVCGSNARVVTPSSSCIVLGLCADDAAKKALLVHSPNAPQQGETGDAAGATRAANSIVFCHLLPSHVPVCCIRCAKTPLSTSRNPMRLQP
jgi:hypothetical protein